MRILDQLAAEAYDAELAAGSGRMASIADVPVRMRAMMSRDQYRQIRTSLLDDALGSAAKREDERRLKRGRSTQLSLFDDDGLEGVWPLGDGGRVEKRVANGVDHGTKVALSMQNAAQVNAALAIEQREYAALQPYYSRDPALTVPAARALWLRDNPGRNAP